MSNLRLGGSLPNLEFGNSTLHGGEVWFERQLRLMEVLTQGNPVYLVLDLPNMCTPVIIGLPIPGLVRVYMNEVHPRSLAGEAGDGRRDYPMPSEPVEYRFGMRLVPWMFESFLSPEHKHRIHVPSIVNYPVLSSGVGHSGVLIRAFRAPNRYSEEWLEIYYFSTGNEYHFNKGWKTDRHTRLIARFRPDGREWRPEQLAACA